jgi:hypothetical protein
MVWIGWKVESGEGKGREVAGEDELRQCAFRRVDRGLSPVFAFDDDMPLQQYNKIFMMMRIFEIGS